MYSDPLTVKRLGSPSHLQARNNVHFHCALVVVVHLSSYTPNLSAFCFLGFFFFSLFSTLVNLHSALHRRIVLRFQMSLNFLKKQSSFHFFFKFLFLFSYPFNPGYNHVSVCKMPVLVSRQSNTHTHRHTHFTIAPPTGRKALADIKTMNTDSRVL